jgi:arylsulfatase A-like enzyme
MRAVEQELPEVLARHYPDAADSAPEIDPEAWEALRWTARADESVLRMALRLVRGLPLPHALLVYFGAPDVVGHKYWRYHQPEVFRYPPTESQIDALGEMVRHAYRQFDVGLGRLLAELPQDATVLVISDHGMHAKKVDHRFEVGAHGHFEQASGGHGDGPPGVLVAAGPKIRRSALADRLDELARSDLPMLGDVVDVAPTILTLRGVPVGRDMDGAVIESLWRPAAAPVQSFVETHDTEDWLDVQRRRADAQRPGEERRLEQLRSLGYVVDDPSD